MKVMWLLFKAGLGVLLSLYVLLMAFIPLLDFIGQPHLPVGLWLALGGWIIGCGFWLLHVFDGRWLMVWLVALAVFHVVLWTVEAVRLPVEVDICLDSGGGWEADARRCVGGYGG